MKLVERISTQNATQSAQTPARTSLMTSSPRRQRDTMADGFQQLKLAVHNRLFETLDVSRLESLEQNMASTKVTQAITEILNEEGRLLTDTDRARLVEEIKNELLGLGPLEPLLWDDDVSDILVNGPNQVYVERQGKLYLTDVRFNDDQHLMLIIDRIVSRSADASMKPRRWSTPAWRTVRVSTRSFRRWRSTARRSRSGVSARSATRWTI